MLDKFHKRTKTTDNTFYLHRPVAVLIEKKCVVNVDNKAKSNNIFNIHIKFV